MTTERPLRLALVLSGAVSLGSFEAGVLQELLDAMQRGAPLIIDLIAGTSAGALVGAVAARSLVTGAPYDDGLRTWRGVTLDLLTRFRPADNDNQGLLSAHALWELQQAYLVRPPDTRPFRPAYPVQRVACLMTLTNLDGLADPAAPDQINFDEDVTFLLDLPKPRVPGETPFIAPIWERIGRVAQASAAFPAAFDAISIPWSERVQAHDLCAEMWHYQAERERLERAQPGIQDGMHYADGGILDQQPLGRALDTLPALIRPLGPGELQRLLFDPDRRFLFIEPDPPQLSLHQGEKEPSAFENVSRALRLWSLSSSPQFSSSGDPDYNLRQSRLLTIVADLAEAQVNDAAGNTPLSLKTLGLEDAAGEEAPDWLAPAIDRFYEWLVASPPDLDNLQDLPTTSTRQKLALTQWVALLRRLRAAYIHLGQLTEGKHRQVALRRVHLTLAGRLKLLGPWALVDWIAPADPAGQLWGTQAVHFGGFLSPRFLAHDYQVGRAYANRWLAQVVPNWANPDAPSPPKPSNVGVTPLLLLQNGRPLIRMGRRLLRNVGRSLGLSNGASTTWSHLLFFSSGVSAAAGLIWLGSAWGQMIYGSGTDPLVLSEPIWVVWATSSLLFAIAGFVGHILLLSAWKRLRNLPHRRQRRAKVSLPQERQRLPL